MVSGTVNSQFLVHDQHLEAVLDIGGADVGVIVEGQDPGVRVQFLQLFCMPLPTTWFGRQPKGWRMMKLRQPSLA